MSENLNKLLQQLEGANGDDVSPLMRGVQLMIRLNDNNLRFTATPQNAGRYEVVEDSETRTPETTGVTRFNKIQ
jgi:hypothetical protein